MHQSVAQQLCSHSQHIKAAAARHNSWGTMKASVFLLPDMMIQGTKVACAHSHIQQSGGCKFIAEDASSDNHAL
jgi:hypothetical protein